MRPPVEDDSDGLEWLDAEEPASQPSQPRQPDGSQLETPRSSASAAAAAAKPAMSPAAALAAAAPSAAATAAGGAAEPLATATASAAAAAAAAADDEQPQKKRGAPRKRRVRTVPADEGDVEGFDFALPPVRKPATPSAAAELAAAAVQQPIDSMDAAASQRSAGLVAATAVAGTSGAADVHTAADASPANDGMDWEVAGVPKDAAAPTAAAASPAAAVTEGASASAAELPTPFGTPAVQEQPPRGRQPDPQAGGRQQPQQASQQPQPQRPAAVPAEVRDTDDWGVEIMDVAAGNATEAVMPDTGGRVAAAAVAEAANNARGAGVPAAC